MKKQNHGGDTEEIRMKKILEEFMERGGGNKAKIFVSGKPKIARCITFQTGTMRKQFEAFPEVVLVDSTHGTNNRRYKLFSFMVHDAFGKGQFVQHSFVDRETAQNMKNAISFFKENNPSWESIAVFMVS
jgi:hypothetical protein